ncbi:MAG: hypothetical protein LBE13_14015 [Bacteroidales bacterium]|jgi:hypothetical protein|nr:hypothetical protein [Bacteroidales bacterium]
MSIKDFEYGQTIWGKIGDNSSKEYFQVDIANIDGLDSAAFINDEFFIMFVDPGIYYIKGVRI